jgi:hypothetical protein
MSTTEWVERARSYEAAARRRAEAAREQAAASRRAGAMKDGRAYDNKAVIQERVAAIQKAIADGLEERAHDARWDEFSGRRTAGNRPAAQLWLPRRGPTGRA